MTDVRLTALNPEDSQVYPVACNTSGEIRLEKQATFDGNLDGDLTVSGSATIGSETALIRSDGSAIFAGNVTAGDYPTPRVHFAASEFFANANPKAATRTNSGAAMVEDGANNGSLFLRNTAGDPNIVLSGSSGSATFAGDVTVGSRSKKWMLVEQGGLCHMVEQVRASTADLVDPSTAEYPKLRDVFQELNIIERCLEEVMTKLRMTEPDGWPVWDGSDNSR